MEQTAAFAASLETQCRDRKRLEHRSNDGGEVVTRSSRAIRRRDVVETSAPFRSCSRIYVSVVGHYRFPESDGKFRGYPSDVYRNQGQSRKRERQPATRVNRWPIDATVCQDGNPEWNSLSLSLSPLQAINAVVGPGCKLRGLLSGRVPN